MTIRTGRGDDTAVVAIDREKCINCGICAKACNSETLLFKDSKVEVHDDSLLGCMGCGACVARCPKGCISVEGRDFHMSDVIELPAAERRAGYDALYGTMMARRSCRHFLDRAVEQEQVDRILAAASAAPMGLPPSATKVLVLDGRDKVREFSWDFIDYVSGFKWMLRPPVLYLWRLGGKGMYELMGSFFGPAVDIFSRKKREGVNWLLYDAPLAMYFYLDDSMGDPGDPYVNATYAMLAAEAMGLGTCMIGSVGPILQYAGGGIKKKYGIPKKVLQGIFVIFGHPAARPGRALKRRLAEVKYY